MIQIILYENDDGDDEWKPNKQTQNGGKNAQKRIKESHSELIWRKKLFNFRWFPHLAISQTVYFYLQHRLIGSDTHKFEYKNLWIAH